MIRLRMWKYRTTEKLYRNLAFLFPPRLIMWCYLRVAARATSGDDSLGHAPDVLMMDALNLWEVDNGI